MQQATTALTQIHAPNGYAIGVGVHNAVTARIAELTNFDLLWVSSLEMSTSKVLPDANVITLTEVAAVVREIRNATSIPIIVDGDNGYGSNETAVRAVREFHLAGASTVCIEDNAFPKRCSFYQGVERSLEDTDIFCARIEAVKQAVPKGQIEIIARTEGLIVGLGAPETLKRVNAYIEAGADAIFVQTNRSTIGDFKAVLHKVKGRVPLVITPTALPDVTAAQLHELGADVIIYSNVVIRTILQSLNQTLTHLRAKQCLNEVNDQIVSLDTIFELVNTDNWLKNTFGKGE